LLKYNPGPAGVPLVLRIELTSPEDGYWYLHYSTATTPLTAPGQVMSMSVKQGYNEFFLRLPEPSFVGELEFHSSSVSGNYLLHSLTIKRESDVY